ncbi:MAG: CARDB domain-containing protein, partial [Desulfobulbaceae bacterium]|nr:CARDB domain-containing protein [Desulfobulbaceae bacterium]
RLTILDNDIPTMTMDLSTSVVSEGGGPAAVHGTLTRSFVTDSEVRVVLSGELGRVRMPNYITFVAGQATAEFDIAILENNLADGDHLVRIGSAVVDQFSSAPLSGTYIEKSLLITDNDGPTLTLTIDKNVLAEAAGANAATATVTRNTVTTEALTVYLTSTDTTEATVQASVEIPAGQQSVTFAVNAIQDGIQDGTQNATLTAAASGFNSASLVLQVTDRELPDLQVQSITLPSSAATSSAIELSWTTINQGLGAANSTWVDNVYLSSDSVLSTDDQLLGSYAGSSPLDTNGSYSKTISVNLGTRVGQLWAFVVTDSGRNVTELNENNNIRAASMMVTPSYGATVSTDTEQA